MKILEISNLSKDFYLKNIDKNIKGCQNISFDVNEGEFVGICGKSGSGKSTILKCINRTYLPQKGSIIYQSQKFGEIDLLTATEQQIIYLRKYEIGYVSQFLNIIPRTTAREIVENSLVEIGYKQNVAKEETIQIFKHFELDEELWDAFPNTFSGGEKLRLNIAQAMIKKPKLLLLDEPTASLDNETKLKVKELIESLKNHGTTMIGIFHDMEFMNNLCDATFNINSGRIVNE